MKLKYIGLSLLALGLWACESDDNTNEITEPEIPLTAGVANLSNYVAIGASYTSGYTDAALFIAGQENSFTNILSQQFAAAGGGEFTQPYTNDNVGGLLLGGNVVASPRLYFNGSGPAVLEAMPTTEIANIIPGPYNNMGVPGAKSFHLLANGYGNIGGVALGQSNPYFVRMASSPNASVLEDILVQQPTFFTMDLGGNDVLFYAISGGTGVDQTGNFDPTTYGPNDITDPNVFAGAMSAIVGALASSGAQGVISNIPDVTDLPYFTTVPYAPLDPTDPDFGPQIPLLNATFAPLNQAYAFLGMPERSIVFSETGASPVVIHDENLPNISEQLFQVLQGGGVDPLTAQLLSQQFAQSRQATMDDLLLLTSATAIGTVDTGYFEYLVSLGVPAQTAGQLSVIGITLPMEDKYVLLPEEAMSIKVATNAYNATIEGLAAANNYGLVDLEGILEQMISTGVQFDGFTITDALVFGGGFSLDGLHLTARGYAYLANEVLRVVDATYGSNFIEAGQVARANDYPITYSPSLQ